MRGKDGKKEAVENKIDFVKWFSELDKNSGKFAGGKGANLSEIYNLKSLQDLWLQRRHTAIS